MDDEEQLLQQLSPLYKLPYIPTHPPSLSLDMAMLSLRLWSILKTRRLFILHLSNDFTLLYSDPLCRGSELNCEKGLSQ